MKVQVLGIGCSNCQQLERRTREALDRIGATAEVEKVTDLATIAGMGVMQMPALAVDGRVVVMGKLPSIEELVAMLSRDVPVAGSGQ
jgi:small redox-active disulfide protein 2